MPLPFRHCKSKKVGATPTTMEGEKHAEIFTKT